MVPPFGQSPSDHLVMEVNGSLVGGIPHHFRDSFLVIFIDGIPVILKMADEYSKPPYNRDSGIPAACT